ncbi:MAG: hypothetical protein V7L05_11055 [Nostoc sp.]
MTIPGTVQSAILVDQVSICDRPYEFYHQPAAYYRNIIIGGDRTP